MEMLCDVAYHASARLNHCDKDEIAIDVLPKKGKQETEKRTFIDEQGNGIVSNTIRNRRTTRKITRKIGRKVLRNATLARSGKVKGSYIELTMTKKNSL